MSAFTPTPEEMANKNEPGKPMGPSTPDNLASGISAANLELLTTQLTDYQAKLAAWQVADQAVHKQIDLVMSGAELLNTIATTVIPAITGLIKGAASTANTASTGPLSGINNALTNLLTGVQQINSLKNAVLPLLASINAAPAA